MALQLTHVDRNTSQPCLSMFDKRSKAMILFWDFRKGKISEKMGSTLEQCTNHKSLKTRKNYQKKISRSVSLGKMKMTESLKDVFITTGHTMNTNKQANE